MPGPKRKCRLPTIDFQVQAAGFRDHLSGYPFFGKGYEDQWWLPFVGKLLNFQNMVLPSSCFRNLVANHLSIHKLWAHQHPAGWPGARAGCLILPSGIYPHLPFRPFTWWAHGCSIHGYLVRYNPTIKNWMGPYQQTPFSKLRSSYWILRFFRGPFRNGPAGDFLECPGAEWMLNGDRINGSYIYIYKY